MKNSILAFTLIPLLLQAENYISLKVSDLSFDDGETPSQRIDSSMPYALKFSRNLRVYLPSNLPYLRTKDASEAFLSFRKEIISSRRHPGFSSDDLILCFRGPKSKIQGTLILYDNQDAWKPFPFTFELKNRKNLLAEQQSEETYLHHRITRYQWLQDLQVPGTAWYRHQVSSDQAKLHKLQGKTVAESIHSGRNGNRPTRKVGIERKMDLFSGGRAISENLQLDRDLRLDADDHNRTIALSSIQGITIEEMPWKEWIGNAKPKLDPSASVLPHDQHAIIFPSYSSMLEVLDQATAQGTPLLRLGEQRAESARSKEKYSQQLCLPVDKLSRTLGSTLISSVAITGSDPFLRTGTSLTIVFEAKNKKALLAALAVRRLEAQNQFPDAKPADGRIPKFDHLRYEGLISNDRSIRSFVASFGKFVVVTNSINQLSRIAGVFSEKEKSLSSLEEYHFFRMRYPITDKMKEDAFLMITDATIRRWCGPEWRIGASRRTRAASSLSELQARHESGIPLKAKEFSGLGKVFLVNGQVQSSKYGNLAFLKSVEELNLGKITAEEKKAYEFFRNRYQSHWSSYFDPIAAQLIIEEGKIEGDLSVLPLIGGTDYRQMIQTVGQVKLKPESGDPHPEALFHWVSAIDMQSSKFKQASSLAAIMAPSLGNTAFGWIGESFSFYLDESPFFAEMQKVFREEGYRAGEEFVEKNLGRIPLGFNVEVRNPFKLTAFLAGLRAWLEQTAPSMTLWTNKSYKGQGYVRIAPGKSVEDDLLREGSAPIALYYVPSPKMLTVSLSEEMIKRTIDRTLLGRKKNANPPPSNWSGMSSAFRASSPILSIFDFTAGEQARNGLQRKSWNNIHILNEWRIHLKREDPLSYHRKVWQTDLLCPGGGQYLWNQEFQTFESSAFGHPADPKFPKKLSLIGDWEAVDFRINFEDNGLRAKAMLERN